MSTKTLCSECGLKKHCKAIATANDHITYACKPCRIKLDYASFIKETE